MKLNRLSAAIVAGWAAVVILSVPALAGQTPQASPAKVKPQSKMAADMSAKCQAMMAGHEKMMTEVKAADGRLDDLVAKMNAASGTEKADAAAAVINEMVTQRRTMRDGMMKMQDGMMAHMMEHVQAGKASMAMCPMMKQMGSMKH
ncbi:MAG: hypothetical protein ACM3NQ_17135 [Bacteroidales bacterium]